MYILERRNYETTYILTPDMQTEEHAALVEKFNKLMADHGCETVNQEIWGFQKLAYKIGNKGTGYYVFTEFVGPCDFIERLEREYEYDERVLRHLTVKLDKHAAAWNVKRRNRKAGKADDNASDNE